MKATGASNVITSHMLPEPTPSAVRAYVARFDNHPNWGVGDRALTDLFRTYPTNTRPEHVLLKIVAVNRLYGTNLFDVYGVAYRVVGLRVDAGINSGSHDVVDAVARANASGRRNYSFATKFCSWHNPARYPIYDSIVDGLLWRFKTETAFAAFDRPSLRRYVEYVAIIDAFRSFFKLDQFDYKEIDKFLWLLGADLRQV